MVHLGNDNLSRGQRNSAIEYTHSYDVCGVAAGMVLACDHKELEQEEEQEKDKREKLTKNGNSAPCKFPSFLSPENMDRGGLAESAP